MSARKSLKVLMVCLGNICRSPTAHGVLSALIKDESYAIIWRWIQLVQDAGIWVKSQIDARYQLQGSRLRLMCLIARQVKIMDFAKFDYILAMDSDNLRDLDKICPNEYKDKLDLLLKFGSSPK